MCRVPTAGQVRREERHMLRQRGQGRDRRSMGWEAMVRILGFHLEPVQDSLQGGLTRLALYGEWKKEYTGQGRLNFSWEWESWKVG